MASTKPKQIEAYQASPEKAGAKPGAALQSIRTQKGLTLAEMSARTGLPVSTLSKIENDKMSLTYDKLARIATALEIDIAQLFAPQAAIGLPGATVSGRRSITRAGEGPEIATPFYHYLYPAADLLKKRFVPMIGEVSARSIEEFGELIRHVGEEYTFVLEGAIEFHTELYAPVLLNKGDSIYFDSGMGHAYIAAAPGPCRLLAICSGPESQLIEAALKGHRPAAPMSVIPAAPEPEKPKPRAGRKRAERS
jgi:transcriptional regulator with XRE-family HTH domain